MNARAVILIALVLAVAGAARPEAGNDDGSTERRTGSGRKRSRGTGSFRSAEQRTPGNVPLDPLFTDQREIRLTFTKVKKSTNCVKLGTAFHARLI